MIIITRTYIAHYTNGLNALHKTKQKVMKNRQMRWLHWPIGIRQE